MGGRDSSSKRKSSKRKRDKISSKKKSRRKESKKRRRVYDSVTSYSDDDSLNLEHGSSSISKPDQKRRINKNKKRRYDSSESSYSDYESLISDSDSLSTYDNGYKSRKARRLQVGLKDRKRKRRKRFTSPFGDVDAHSVRRRKRLDRDRVVKPIKKSSKKKSRKHVSSSSSSDSVSCPACQSRSSSSTADGKHQRSKVVLEKEIERPKCRELHKGKTKHKVGSPSCSSCSWSRDPSASVNYSEGALFPMNNSTRLRSVIAVVDQPHDEGENRWEMVQHKEEIVYDQNDYPSPKSLHSNEGGSKMESGSHSHREFNNRICVENVRGEEVTELEKSRIDEGDQNDAGDHQSEGAHMYNSEKEKEIDASVANDALGGDVLESILRQKALDNLRKFQERFQTGPRSTTVEINNEIDVDRSFAGSVDVVQKKSVKQLSSDAGEINQSGFSPNRDFSLITEFKRLPDSEPVEKDPGMAKQSVFLPSDGAALVECPDKDKRASSCAFLPKPVSGSDTTSGARGYARGYTVEPSSSVRPTSGQHGLEQGNEAKDGSQFEQKTMSVMRGGEIVQVSYKVYIPKKVPALARRQLRR